MMGTGMTGGGMGGWMVFNMIFWLLLVIGFILLAAWVIQKYAAGGGRTGETALDILKKRYARGEITREEYEEKKRDIS